METDMIYENSKKYAGAEPHLFWCAYDEYIEPGRSYGPLVRNSFCVECIISGAGSVNINDKIFPLRKGDCYVSMPGQRLVYSSDRLESRKGAFCLIAGHRIGQILAQAGINEKNPYVPREAFDEVFDCIRRLIEMNGENDGGAELRRTGAIYELLGAIMRSRPSPDKNAWLQRALGMFEAEYHTDITVASVAATVGFERCYFSSIFKEYTGLTPHKYLTSLRIAKACELFAKSSLSVAEIAESVGIDSSNFARVFKAEMGISPVKYREYLKRGK